MGIGNPGRAHRKGGSPGPLQGDRRRRSWDPPRPVPAPRRGRPPYPAGAVTSRDLTTRDYAVEPADHDGPLCRRCHGQALTPTSMLCPARQPTTRSAATRLVPTMPVRPLLVGTPTRARAAPSELHPAGRRCALKAPYPRHRPLLHSLERGFQRCNRGYVVAVEPSSDTPVGLPSGQRTHHA
jgi:hypothetical protein